MIPGQKKFFMQSNPHAATTVVNSGLYGCNQLLSGVAIWPADGGGMWQQLTLGKANETTQSAVLRFGHDTFKQYRVEHSKPLWMTHRYTPYKRNG